jgi:hypothetical protein
LGGIGGGGVFVSRPFWISDILLKGFSGTGGALFFFFTLFSTK